MKTVIKVWSDIGHCPITKRAGNYCDLLVDQESNIFDVSPAKARKIVESLIKSTPHARSGYFCIVNWMNQNTRESFV